MPPAPGAISRRRYVISPSSTARTIRRSCACSPPFAPTRCSAPERAALGARRIDRDRLPRGCPRLFTHNAAVDDINLKELAKLEGETHPFAMTAKGPEAFVRTLQRGCLSPETLALKEGAVVMFTKNDPGGRYVNGTLGTVVDFEDEEGYPVVRTLGGRRVVAEPATWKIEENGRDRASVTQVPLRLAWAITVHKSQGMSLDAAVIDLSRAFEYGQGYVALSRLRTLSGLHLLGLNERALRVHPEAVEKDAEFRAASETARQALSAACQELRRSSRRLAPRLPPRATMSARFGRATATLMPRGPRTTISSSGAVIRPATPSRQSPRSSAASPAPSAPASRSSASSSPKHPAPVTRVRLDDAQAGGLPPLSGQIIGPASPQIEILRSSSGGTLTVAATSCLVMRSFQR